MEGRDRELAGGRGRVIECAREWPSVPDRCDGPLWAATLGMRVVGGG